MNRRTVAVLVAATTLAGALAGCSGGGDTAAGTATTAASTAAAAPPSSGAAPSASAAPPAGIPSAGPAPARAFAVGTRTLSLSRGAGRPLRTTVWYPATGAAGGKPAPGLPVATGPFPLVLFSHGLRAQPSDYAVVVARWAQAGFVVAAPAYPRTSTGVREFQAADILNQPADATQVITAVLALNGRAGDPLRGRIDADRIAAAGHSAGGITTIGMLSGNRDARLDAAIVMSGRQVVQAPFAGPPTPVLFVHGKLDKTVTYADGLTAFRAVPWPKALVGFAGGGHIATGQDLRVVLETSTEFLRYTLYGDAAARARIAAAARQGGGATYTDKL
jgi:fermentation-respiration switch protein FrsA (DUF1100 family)